MRRLSAREVRLALITGVALAGGLTYFVVRGRLQRLEEIERRSVEVEVELLRQEELLDRRPELLQSSQRIRAQLPRHAEGRDIKSELSRQVQSLAVQSGLRITSLTPETEEYIPELDLYEMAIRCSFEGSPERMVDFLHRLNQLGSVTDIQELRVRNRDEGGERVSGNFTLDFAYSRVPAAEVAPPAETPAEPADRGVAL